MIVKQLTRMQVKTMTGSIAARNVSVSLLDPATPVEESSPAGGGSELLDMRARKRVV
jgi:hypothetical protein